MSLKAFHVFFVVVSTLLSFLVGAWGLMEYQRTGQASRLGFGVGGLIGGGVLIAYGFWFLRKLKGVES